MPDIDVQIKGRTNTAFGGNVFAIAAGPTSNTTSHGLATSVRNADSLKSDDLTGTPKEDATASGLVYVDISKVDRVRVGERWSVTENIDQLDGADRGIFGAPLPDSRPDYSHVVFGNSGRPALTAAAAWSNTEPNATTLFTILTRVL
ncbi:hypothetical protein [Roseobacter sp.]|uniref:hypothetical protein n=1 Tax=Roseobacter sp. TaxID=1907202 RepID=UPI00385AEED0